MKYSEWPVALILVEHNVLSSAVVAGIDALPPPKVQMKCPHCHSAVAVPVMVHERQYRKMEKLIEIVEKYIADKNIAQKMLAEMLSTAAILAARERSKS